MDHTILCKASDRSPKKVKFRRILLGKLTGIFAANLAEHQLVKNRLILWLFLGKTSLETDWFCAD